MNADFQISVWDPRWPGMMIEALEQSQLAQGLIQALYLQGHRLRSGPDVELYIRDDGRGKSLIIPDPAPPAFIAALMLALPGAALLPVDLSEVPLRLLMRIGVRGLMLAPLQPTQRLAEAAIG